MSDNQKGGCLAALFFSGWILVAVGLASVGWWLVAVWTGLWLCFLAIKAEL